MIKIELLWVWICVLIQSDNNFYICQDNKNVKKLGIICKFLLFSHIFSLKGHNYVKTRISNLRIRVAKVFSMIISNPIIDLVKFYNIWSSSLLVSAQYYIRLFISDS